jgi:DNA-binding GntR family transcriptional regulator
LPHDLRVRLPGAHPRSCARTRQADKPCRHAPGSHGDRTLAGTARGAARDFEAAEASRKARDPLSYEKADAAFHRRIAIAARNPLLITVFDAILNVPSDGRWRHGRETAYCINNRATYAAAHRRIAAAVAELNPVLAEEAMRAHLSKVQQQLNEHAFSRPEPTTDARPRPSNGI